MQGAINVCQRARSSTLANSKDVAPNRSSGGVHKQPLNVVATHPSFHLPAQSFASLQSLRLLDPDSFLFVHMHAVGMN